MEYSKSTGNDKKLTLRLIDTILSSSFQQCRLDKRLEAIQQLIK